MTSRSFPLKSAALSIVAISFALVSLCPAAATKTVRPNWELLKKTKQYTAYINTASIESTADTSKAWCKTMANTKEYREFIADLRMADGRSTVGYNRYAYTLSLVEIDCAGERHRTLEATDYDRSGKALGKPLPKEDWAPTESDTVSSSLAAWLCEGHPLLEGALDEKDR